MSTTVINKVYAIIDDVISTTIPEIVISRDEMDLALGTYNKETGDTSAKYRITTISVHFNDQNEQIGGVMTYTFTSDILGPFHDKFTFTADKYMPDGVRIDRVYQFIKSKYPDIFSSDDIIVEPKTYWIKTTDPLDGEISVYEIDDQLGPNCHSLFKTCIKWLRTVYTDSDYEIFDKLPETLSSHSIKTYSDLKAILVMHVMGLS